MPPPPPGGVFDLFRARPLPAAHRVRYLLPPRTARGDAPVRLGQGEAVVAVPSTGAGERGPSHPLTAEPPLRLVPLGADVEEGEDPFEARTVRTIVSRSVGGPKRPEGHRTVPGHLRHLEARARRAEGARSPSSVHRRDLGGRGTVPGLTSCPSGSGRHLPETTTAGRDKRWSGGPRGADGRALETPFIRTGACGGVRAPKGGSTLAPPEVEPGRPGQDRSARSARHGPAGSGFSGLGWEAGP